MSDPLGQSLAVAATDGRLEPTGHGEGRPGREAQQVGEVDVVSQYDARPLPQPAESGRVVLRVAEHVENLFEPAENPFVATKPTGIRALQPLGHLHGPRISITPVREARDGFAAVAFTSLEPLAEHPG